jgi:hypothetical protein
MNDSRFEDPGGLSRMAVKPLRVRKHHLACSGVVLLIGLVTVAVWQFRARQRRHALDELVAATHQTRTVVVDRETEAQIVAFCSDCHKLPRFDGFPRDAWHEMVWRGYEFYARSGRNDLDPPPVQVTAAYFRSHAPEQLVFPEPKDTTRVLQATFVKRDHPGSSVAPAIAHTRWLPEWSPGPRLLACDMRDGRIMSVDLTRPDNSHQVLAQLNHPCHAEECDLNGDQILDLVVADLGSFTPDDHNLGRVIWLRGTDEPTHFEEVVLADGLGRVADVRPADVDLDGDLDLIVAEFGLHATGRILLLENIAAEGEPLSFSRRTIDPRPGTIHVPVHDLNGDGYPDFFALISQEYESVEAFINQGNGEFRAHPLWSAPALTFGSSGIEPADFDQDGDLDVLLTNGDSFDNSYANPSHGIQWLENVGDLKFEYHRLADLVGAFRALPTDIDLDGDLDIVAVAWLPEEVKPVELAGKTLPSLICLEQTSPGKFARHTLESGLPRNASLEIADFDDDGDYDLVLGAVGAHWLTVWTNQLNN